MINIFNTNKIANKITRGESFLSSFFSLHVVERKLGELFFFLFIFNRDARRNAREIMSRFIFILVHPVEGGGSWRVTRIPQGFIREEGEGGLAVWGKLKMSIKSIRKRGSTKAKIAVEHCSAKGQFIFVCYINFLLRLLSSSSSSSSSSLLKNLRVSSSSSSSFLSIAFASTLPPSFDLYSLVSSLKTVNSARHQGECELARLSYPRR